MKIKVKELLPCAKNLTKSIKQNTLAGLDSDLSNE